MFKFKTKDSGLLAKFAEKLHGISHLPRWAIFAIDIAIVVFSLLVTYFLMDIWRIQGFGSYNTYITFLFMIAVMAFYLIIFKVSSGVVRHSSIRDIVKISIATICALITFLIISYVFYFFWGSKQQPEKLLLYDPPLIFFILFTFLLLSELLQRLF